MEVRKIYEERKRNCMRKNQKRDRRISFVLFFIISTLLFPNSEGILAQVMSSPSYQLERDSINFAGGRGTSASFIGEDTLGEEGVGPSSSASFNLQGGFQQQDTPDTQSPTLPTGLVATALSSSEISLGWNASLDNIGIGGYQVFRDGEAIATTTVTSYSDTGLSSETTYLYNVQAFDTSFNYSSTSATATAQTLAVTVQQAATLGGGPPFSSPNITDVSIEINESSAQIEWDTDTGARSTLRWGETTDYEQGRYQEETFPTDHEHTIEDLLPGTEYTFAIFIISEQGFTNEIVNQKFTTLPLHDNNPPLTVIDFNALFDGSAVNLAWTNPSDEDFKGVRIVRSADFYPANVFDGDVIYEGTGSNRRDTTVRRGNTYYYTLFTNDGNGNYSSGAIVSVAVPLLGETTLPVENEIGSISDRDPFVDIPVSTSTDLLIDDLRLSDFDFFQNGTKVLRTRKFVAPVDAAVPLTISIDYEKLPEVLKTIVVSLVDPDNPEARFSFLLRVNNDKSAYVATIGALERIGTFNMDILVLDYSNQSLSRIDGALRSTHFGDEQRGVPIRGAIYLYYVVRFNFMKIVLLTLVVIVPLLVYLKKRRKVYEPKG